jgi:hypothetical protein
MKSAPRASRSCDGSRHRIRGRGSGAGGGERKRSHSHSGATCCGWPSFTLVLHVPFLRQPVEGDEVTYLDIARHVFEQPLTPQNFQYVFSGRLVDAAGHPHPPLDAYLVALAWILRGHVSVLFFHAFYLIFALGISFAAYALAARFTTRPLWAALLVAACPLVQANTNTLAGPESPGLCFLLAGAAAFFWRRFLLSGGRAHPGRPDGVAGAGAGAHFAGGVPGAPRAATALRLARARGSVRGAGRVAGDAICAAAPASRRGAVPLCQLPRTVRRKAG